MQTGLIFLCVYGAMISASFWEAYVEGRNAWDAGKLGWKIKIGKYVVLTAYHFFLFFMMFPLLLILPLVVYGFDLRLVGILISAYASGMILEDFFWFVVNPTFKIKNWNSKHVTWYPWLKIGKFELPVGYITGLIVFFVSWYFLWG
jgi:hypothetical protein